MTTRNSAPALRRAAATVLAAGTLALAGCASGPNANPRDPFEPYNRQMTLVNEKVDAVVLKPTATFYREYVPALVRTGVSNFFANLGDAWSAANSLLQFKLGNAAENWMRFSFNTVFGFAGVLDIASDMNIERHKEDFGQTLGRWGVPAGPYVVLPLLGPSTLRDTAALPVDWRGDLVNRVEPDGVRDGFYGLRIVNVRANLLRASDVLEGAAIDKYSFIRDAYLQRRQAEVSDFAPRDGDGSDKDGSDKDGSEGQIPPEPAPSR
jgi:phospholipid-binding lipoprotein MlaA